MDEIGYKHRSSSDTDDENTHLSKRLKLAPVDENQDPLLSVSANKGESSHHQRLSTVNSFNTNLRSASKSSPLAAILLGEMGLGVLDSDESNQSSLIGNAIATLTQPSSALSMIPSELSNGSNSNSPMQSSENDEMIADNRHTLSELSHISASDTYSSLPTLQSDSKSSDIGFASNQLRDAQFNIYKDYTPANLVPCNRTNFRGVISVDASNVTLPTHSMAGAPETEEFSYQPPEGRAIRNTSMRQFSKQNAETDSAKKYKGRSPLATIGNLASIQSPIASDLGEAGMKPISVEESFFMFQQRDPRIYTGEDNFARLSDEVLLSIFKWLPKRTLIRCSLVNRRFHRVTQDESLWTRLDLAGKTIQQYALGRILARGIVIIRLAQCNIMEPIFDPATIQKEFLTKVQYLDLSMASITCSGLVQLFSRCRQLKKLSLEHVPLNDSVCKALAQNRKMEVLNLAMCTGLTSYGVRKLLGSFKHLHTLNISWTLLDAETIREIPNYINENLQRLNIAGCRKTMSDDALTKIVERCPQLRELDLSDCTALSSRTIDIVANLKHLEYLSLSRCYNINASAYLEINKIDSLAYLDIFGVLSEVALDILGKNLTEIGINKFKHSAVARPTVGNRRTSIWGLRTRD